MLQDNRTTINKNSSSVKCSSRCSKEKLISCVIKTGSFQSSVSLWTEKQKIQTERQISNLLRGNNQELFAFQQKHYQWKHQCWLPSISLVHDRNNCRMDYLIWQTPAILTFHFRCRPFVHIQMLVFAQKSQRD